MCLRSCFIQKLPDMTNMVWKEGFQKSNFQNQLSDTGFINGLNQRASEIQKSWCINLGSYFIPTMPDMTNMVWKEGFQKCSLLKQSSKPGL